MPIPLITLSIPDQDVRAHERIREIAVSCSGSQVSTCYSRAGDWTAKFLYPTEQDRAQCSLLLRMYRADMVLVEHEYQG